MSRRCSMARISPNRHCETHQVSGMALSKCATPLGGRGTLPMLREMGFCEVSPISYADGPDSPCDLACSPTADARPRITHRRTIESLKNEKALAERRYADTCSELESKVHAYENMDKVREAIAVERNALGRELATLKGHAQSLSMKIIPVSPPPCILCTRGTLFSRWSGCLPHLPLCSNPWSMTSSSLNPCCQPKPVGQANRTSRAPALVGH